jgi:ribosomal protein S6--L-glutamate ligase
MVFRLGILGSPTGPYVRDLVRACNECLIDVQLLGFPELQTSIAAPRRNSLPTNLPTQPSGELAQVLLPTGTPPELDAIIVRTMPLGSLEQVIFRMDCLHVWQSHGTAVINSPRCLETSIDKWLTLHRLSAAGIPVPPTIACQTRDQALAAYEQLGGDVLVKPLFGGEGRGIIRLQDFDMAWRCLSTLQQLGHVLYLQQFIPNFGYDIRVLMIGDQLFSISRQARDGCYRTNVSLGGTAVPHELTEQQREIAVLAAKAVDGCVVGVDLLPAKDGKLFVLEVNAVPGWKGVASSLSIDIAKQFVQYVARRATSS